MRGVGGVPSALRLALLLASLIRKMRQRFVYNTYVFSLCEVWCAQGRKLGFAGGWELFEAGLEVPRRSDASAAPLPQLVAQRLLPAGRHSVSRPGGLLYTACWPLTTRQLRLAAAFIPLTAGRSTRRPLQPSQSMLLGSRRRRQHRPSKGTHKLPDACECQRLS